MRLIGLKSRDLTCILISEDKASAKKIKENSAEIANRASTGVGRVVILGICQYKLNRRKYDLGDAMTVNNALQGK